jgi:hypothetical protein
MRIAAPRCEESRLALAGRLTTFRLRLIPRESPRDQAFEVAMRRISP